MISLVLLDNRSSQLPAADYYILKYPGMAGQPICVQGNEPSTIHNDFRVYAPFSSKFEWEFVRWAKLRGPSQTALAELLAIPEVSHSSIAWNIFLTFNRLANDWNSHFGHQMK